MFKRNMNRSPKQKAEKAQMNLIARLAGCGLLIYYVVKLLSSPDAPRTPIAILIGIVFIAAAAFVIVINIRDFIIGWKQGRYKQSTYEEEDLAEYLETREPDEEGCTSEDEQPELDAHEETGIAPDADKKDSEE